MGNRDDCLLGAPLLGLHSYSFLCCILPGPRCLHLLFDHESERCASSKVLCICPTTSSPMTPAGTNSSKSVKSEGWSICPSNPHQQPTAKVPRHPATSRERLIPVLKVDHSPHPLTRWAARQKPPRHACVPEHNPQAVCIP